MSCSSWALEEMKRCLKLVTFLGHQDMVILVQYINKYIDKGGDCGTIAVHNKEDKVKQHIDSHYVMLIKVVTVHA